MPTSASEGLIGIPLERVTNDKSGWVRKGPAIIENLITLDIPGLSTTNTAIGIADKTQNITNNIISLRSTLLNWQSQNDKPVDETPKKN